MTTVPGLAIVLALFAVLAVTVAPVVGDLLAAAGEAGR